MEKQRGFEGGISKGSLCSNLRGRWAAIGILLHETIHQAQLQLASSFKTHAREDSTGSTNNIQPAVHRLCEEDGLELLERARGVFWSRALRLLIPLEDSIAVFR